MATNPYASILDSVLGKAAGGAPPSLPEREENPYARILSSVLPKPDLPSDASIKPGPSMLQEAGAFASRIGAPIVGGVLGGVVGSALAPGPGSVAGIAAGSAIGAGLFGAAGEVGAEKILGEEVDPVEVGLAGALSAVPAGPVGRMLARPGLSLARRAALHTGEGAVQGLLDATARPLVKEQRLPTAGELGAGAVGGAVLGGGLGLGLEKLAGANQAFRPLAKPPLQSKIDAAIAPGLQPTPPPVAPEPPPLDIEAERAFLRPDPEAVANEYMARSTRQFLADRRMPRTPEQVAADFATLNPPEPEPVLPDAWEGPEIRSPQEILSDLSDLRAEQGIDAATEAALSAGGPPRLAGGPGVRLSPEARLRMAAPEPTPPVAALEQAAAPIEPSVPEIVPPVAINAAEVIPTATVASDAGVRAPSFTETEVPRGPERRQEVLPVSDERRLAQRRALAEQYQLPEDHPAVEGLLAREAERDAAQEAAGTDPLTGLGSLRAFEAEDHPALAAFDVAGLKWFNDTHGHPAGNVLLQAVGDAIKSEPGVKGFHPHGDEFFVRADTPEAAEAAARNIQERLARSEISYTTPDGNVLRWTGGRVDYGIGINKERADAALLAARERLKAAGQRAKRGERPFGLAEVTPPRRDVLDQASEVTPAVQESAPFTVNERADETLPFFRPDAEDASQTLEMRAASDETLPYFRPDSMDLESRTLEMPAAPSVEPATPPRIEERAPEAASPESVPQRVIRSREQAQQLKHGVSLTVQGLKEQTAHARSLPAATRAQRAESIIRVAEEELARLDATKTNKYVQVVENARQALKKQLSQAKAILTAARRETGELGPAAKRADLLERARTKPENERGTFDRRLLGDDSEAKDEIDRYLIQSAPTLYEGGKPRLSPEDPLLEVDADGKAIAKAIALDGDNPLYRDARKRYEVAVAERDADISFNPEELEGVKYATRPAPGQRGLPGLGTDVPERGTKPRGPEQRAMFGGEMLQGTEARVTEGREGSGPLFTQDAEARARAEKAGQGGIKFAAKPFYSQLERVAEKIPQPMKGADMARYLADPKRGVKAEEMKWTGLDDFLKSKAGERVTPQEVRDSVAQNKVEVREVTLGAGPKADAAGLEKRKAIFARYKPEIDAARKRLDDYHPGDRGEGRSSAFEELERIEARRDAEADAAYKIPEYNPTKFSQYQTPGGENYRELLLTLPLPSDAAKPEGNPDISAATIKSAFAAGEVKELRDGAWDVSLPGDRKIQVRVRPDGIEYNKTSFEQGYKRELGEGEEIVGAWQKIDQGGLVFLSKQADQGTVHHEAFHAGMDLALSPKEQAAVLKKYGNEEAAAEAYAKWEPGKQTNSWFTRIAQFFRKVYRTLSPSWESSFERVRSGEAYAPRKDTTIRGETVRPRGVDRGSERTAFSTMAYHGSPHDFDKFDSSKIGTGEGAQAYGHGLYFAGKKDVAEYYRKSLAGPDFEYLDPDVLRSKKAEFVEKYSEDAYGSALYWLNATKGNVKRAAALARNRAENYRGTPDEAADRQAGNLLTMLSMSEPLQQKRSGKTYEVELAPDEGDFLDWDKPLSEQSEKVKAGLARLANDSRLGWLKDYIARGVLKDGANTASSIYKRIAKSVGIDSGNAGALPQWVRDQNVRISNERAASSALHEAGIPGIRYLDQSSRGGGHTVRWAADGKTAEVVAPDGSVRSFPSFKEADAWVEQNAAKSHNYVVFDDSLVTTRAKYATAPKMPPQAGRAEPARSEPEIPRTAISGRPVKPEETPRVEGKVEALRQSEKAAGQAPSDLARDEPRHWKDLDPEVQKYLRKHDDEQILRAASQGKLDDVGMMALDARVRDARERFETARAKVASGESSTDEQREALADALQIAALEHVSLARGDVEAGTRAGRALAARARVMEAAAAPGDQFLKRILREIEGVSDEQAADLVRIFHESPKHLPEALARAMKPGKFAKWVELWKAGLVSAPGTQVANVLGNVGEQAARVGETWTASLVDKIIGGQRERFSGEAGAELSGSVSRLRDALGDLGADLKDIVKLAPEKLDLSKPLEYQVGKIAGKKGRAIRAPFRMLSSFDNFFKNIGGDAELGKLAYRQAKQELPQQSEAAIRSRARVIREQALDPENTKHVELLKQVANARQERTFQAAPGPLMSSLMRMRSEHPWLHVVAPFLQTPGNIAKITLERSPVGFVKAAKAYKSWQAAVRKGADAETLGKLRGEAVDAIARPLMGTALLGTFAAVAKAGGMTGSGPVDPGEQNLLKETGWQPYSFVVPVGDSKVYIPYNRFEPLSSVLGIAADLVEIKDSKKAGDAADKFLGTIASNLTSKTYLRGLSDATNVISRPREFLGQYVTNFAGSLVPNVVAKGAQAIDPKLRDTGVDQPEKILKAIVARIPGASYSLPARKSATGEDIERPGGALTRLLSPVQPSMTKPGKELESLLVDVGYVPRAPREISVKGKKVRLDGDEYALMQEADRRAAEYIRKNYLSSAAFNRLPDTIAEGGSKSKEAYIRKIYDRSRDAMKQRIYRVPRFKEAYRSAVNP